MLDHLKNTIPVVGITRQYVRNLLDELKPQFGSLHFEDPAGQVIALTPTPQKLTLFDSDDTFNDQINADHTADTITIENTNIEDPNFYKVFGAGITGVGLVCEGRIGASLEGTGSNVVNIELYIDGIATGLISKYRTHNQERQASEFFRVEIPNDAVCEYYVYSDGASFNVTFYKIDVDIQKLPLGVSSEALTAVTALTT